MTVSRLLIATPASGSGKTAVTVGLLPALSARGLCVSPFQVGPDYVDPGYLNLPGAPSASSPLFPNQPVGNPSLPCARARRMRWMPTVASRVPARG